MLFLPLLGFASPALVCAQNVGGLYTFAYTSADIDIKPDHTLICNWHSPCGVTPGISRPGRWRKDADTVFVRLEKDTFEVKYLFDYKYSVNRKGKIFRDSIPLVELYEDDSIIPHEFDNFTDLLVFLHGGYLEKSKSYYDDGTIEYLKGSDENRKNRMEYYNYPNGQVKEIRQYHRNKKSGDWYFYAENGNLIKTLRYRRGHLRKTLFQQ